MKITRKHLRQIIREELRTISEQHTYLVETSSMESQEIFNAKTGESHRVRIFDKPIRITAKGLNVAGTRFRLEVDGPGRINPDLTPLKATLHTDSSTGEHALDVVLDVDMPGVGVKDGTIGHDRLENMVSSLADKKYWEGSVATEKGDKTVMIKQT